jgi:integrase
VSITRRPDGRWRARIRVDGREYAKHFDRKLDAQRWEDGEKAKLAMGTWTDPKTAQTTVADWCQTWLRGYGGHRPNTVKTAQRDVTRITAEFGRYRLAAVRPSDVQRWVARLQAEGLKPSYVRALHRRLAQIMAGAVYDGIIPKSPCSPRTSPPAGRKRSYVATTRQVWNLHEAFPPRLRVAVSLGAFAGLRVGEACGLRPQDVDFAAGMIRPRVQYPADPLKTDISQTAIPAPPSLMDELSAHMLAYPGDRVLGVSPNVIEKCMRRVRGSVPGLPEGFRYHDLRHYFASALIHSGLSITTVQARVRHEDVKTTLGTYGHLWPDQDAATRDAMEAFFHDR